MMRKLAYVLLALLTMPLGAQDFKTQRLFSAYDLTAVGVGNRTYVNFGPVITGPSGVTAATSTTATGPAGTFRDLAVGDEINVFKVATGTTDVRLVTAKASDVSLTLSSAATWSDNAWSFRKRDAGTTASAGAFDTSKFVPPWSLNIRVATINATDGIQFNLECSIGTTPGGAATSRLWTQVWPGTGTSTACELATLTAVSSCMIDVRQYYQACRIGMYIVTADTGAQSISAFIAGGAN